MTDVKWVATISDGTTAAEHSGEYSIIPGKRKPWVRLTEDLHKKGLHLTSLRLNYDGRTIHMPRAKFDRFGLNSKSVPPEFYSLNYLIEGSLAPGGVLEQDNFIDLVAHYNDFQVHYIQDIQNGNNAWVTITKDFLPMASTPRE